MRADEADTLQFRNRRERHRQYPHQGGTPFWRIVGAVFVALCLFGVLQAILVAIVYSRAKSDLEDLVAGWEAETAAIARQADAAREQIDKCVSVPRRQTARPRPPGMAGPVEARRLGYASACIGGRVSKRLPSGWDQGEERCTALSD